MVLETDAPYLASEPFDIPALAERVAELPHGVRKQVPLRSERWGSFKGGRKTGGLPARADSLQSVCKLVCASWCV